eukprot:UN07517
MQSVKNSLKHITRKSFNCNLNVNQIRLKISNAIDFQSNKDLVQAFVDIFGKYGLVLLEFDNYAENTEETMENNLLNLQPLFGTISHYDKSSDAKGRGFVHIDSRTPNAVIDKATETFPVHTDGTYKAMPEKIQSLGCVVPARPSGGGKSIFISGSYLMEYIYHLCDGNDIYYDGLSILFNNNCMTMGRALINEQYRENEKAVL